MKKIVLVTGATDGIGKKTAQRLVEGGYHVIVHGRDSKRVLATVEELSVGPGSVSVDSIVFDLSSLNDVKRGAREIQDRFPHLDVLLNNAGTYQVDRRESVDGFEMTIAINHLGPTLLTLLLKPVLKKSPAARVIFVSSVAHMRGKLDIQNFNFEKSFGAYDAYATSKLANVITARELARLWKKDDIPVYTLHPGVITTKLLKLGFNTSGDTVENGSNTSVYLATALLDDSFNGKYFVDSQPTSVSPLLENKEKVDAYWRWTMESLEKYVDMPVGL